jgi:hypothetical protein
MNRAPIILLIAFVLVAGAATAWFFGWIAGENYATQDNGHTFSVPRPVVMIGEGWGAVTGLMAGAIWCRVMVPKALRAPQSRWAGAGALAGLAVGLLSTILLHAVLIAVSAQTDQRILTIVPTVGLICGVVAGLVVGAICGGLCGVAARRARAEPGRNEETKPQ